MRRGLTDHVDAVTRDTIVIDCTSRTGGAWRTGSAAVVISLVSVRSIDVVLAVLRTAFSPETYAIAAVRLANEGCAFDTLPLIADAVVQIRAVCAVRNGHILRRPVVTSIKRAWVVIEGNVTRIYEFNMTPEDITIASLAVPRVIG
jgi:hypothetical protein